MNHIIDPRGGWIRLDSVARVGPPSHCRPGSYSFDVQFVAGYSWYYSSFDDADAAVLRDFRARLIAALTTPAPVSP